MSEFCISAWVTEMQIEGKGNKVGGGGEGLQKWRKKDLGEKKSLKDCGVSVPNRIWYLPCF